MKKRLTNDIDPHWRKVFSKFLAKNQKQKALNILDAMLTDNSSLFSGLPEFQEDKRIALLLRIDLLRHWDRELEALAWLCLECELRPDNKLAQLLKGGLKHQLNISSNNVVSKEEFDNTISDIIYGWDEIAGMRELKTILTNDLIKPILNPQLYSKFKITTPNGIIFFGPSGCGKTFIARKIADAIGYNFIEVKPGDIASTYVHGTQGKIKDVFEEARNDSPTLLFFDEFDALVPNRNDTSHHYKSEVNEFLAQMDNLNTENVLVVAATNLISSIDPAVLRPGRIDRKIFIPPPDFESRHEAFKMFMEGRPQSNIDYIRLAEYTENYTFAEIKELVNRAAITGANTNKKITTDNIVELILENPASLTDENIEKMK
ncbi:MAG: hypothetical protein COW71_07515 [Ignavibacteriales bacterium CG18_big_fil_WC_8_21_14_2_50_31_20]|nr:MAG: hypothetical protein COW71_07515 [Ignavibacteriales bacterium CG18_big_fil_WC_8_21_14_2_50_31_20]